MILCYNISIQFSDKRGENLKKRIFNIIQIGYNKDTVSRAFDWFLVIIIILGIITMFLETFDELSAFFPLFKGIEYFAAGVFIVEYILRIWTADLLYPNLSPRKARLRFLHSFDGIVDLLTILPFFFLTGFIVFRMLRVVRIFHLFRINAQYDSFNVITAVLYEKKNQIISSVFIIIILMLASSLCMYSVEHEAQPDSFRNAFSGIWWSMSTLLTVGYGDIYPVTILGKAMAICIAFLGVGVVAIPTGIISAGFVEQYTKKEHADTKFHDIESVGEIMIEEGNELIGMNVEEIFDEYAIQILLIIRKDMTIIATPSLHILQHDILVISSDKLIKKKPKKNSRGR